MDPDIYKRTLEYFDLIPSKHVNYCGVQIPCSIFHQLKDFYFVNNKYLYVSPPIPGINVDILNAAMNVFGSRYNQYYNEKHNISYSDFSYSDSSDE